MYIEKCDLCKKELKDRKHVKIGYGSLFPNRALCDRCSKPILVFLKKNKLFEEAK